MTTIAHDISDRAWETIALHLPGGLAKSDDLPKTIAALSMPYSGFFAPAHPGATCL